MKRVLVTGASGFIGRHSLPILVRHGYEVHAVSFKTAVDGPEGVRWYRADLLNPAEVERVIAEIRPTHLLHLAWYAVPRDYRTSPVNLRWIQASIELLGQFREHGGKRAVFAGTCFEYDTRYGFCSEAITPCKPSTFYGLCKSALQQAMCGFGENSGVSIAWGRIFFLYGPYEARGRLVSSVVAGLLRREPVKCSHGLQLRDFMHVVDVAGAMVALLESTATGPVNIGSGTPTQLREIILSVADALDGRSLINLGALPVPSDDPPIIVADARRLRSEIGWKPAISLKAGLEETVRWWSDRV